MIEAIRQCLAVKWMLEEFDTDGDGFSDGVEVELEHHRMIQMIIQRQTFQILLMHWLEKR